MDKTQKAKIKKILLDMREEIIKKVKQIEKENFSQSQREASGDLSGYSFHMADVASDSFERELSWDRASVEQKVLFHIDDALKRIEDGVYGKCESCQKKINKQRLKAIPYARLCRMCQEKREKES